MDKVLNMLGLAARAGKAASGEDTVLDAVRSRKAGLVIAAADASERSVKLYRDKCAFYHVPFALYATKDELGHAIGREERSAVAVTDRNLSEAVLKLLDLFDGGN